MRAILVVDDDQWSQRIVVRRCSRCAAIEVLAARTDAERTRAARRTRPTRAPRHPRSRAAAARCCCGEIRARGAREPAGDRADRVGDERRSRAVPAAGLHRLPEQADRRAVRSAPTVEHYIAEAE